MLYAGIEWPEGWVPGDRHVTMILGVHVIRRTEPGHERPAPAPYGADSWVAEYLTTSATWDVAACKDPLLACGLCLLYDTTEADKIEVW